MTPDLKIGSLAWLFARPIAHRGLHDADEGVVENTPSAVARAVENGYGVEIDVRVTADDQVVVFHDAALDRLMDATGPVVRRTLAELRAIPFRKTRDRLMTLDECIDLVDGRQALVVEIKSEFRRNLRPGRLVAERLLDRKFEQVAIKSFDPMLLEEVRARAPKIPRGVVGEAFDDDDPAWNALSFAERADARMISHWPRTRPHFLSWSIDDLDRGPVKIARQSGVKVMTWTVRTPEQRAVAEQSADQMVFEGFLP